MESRRKRRGLQPFVGNEVTEECSSYSSKFQLARADAVDCIIIRVVNVKVAIIGHIEPEAGSALINNRRDINAARSFDKSASCNSLEEGPPT